MPSDPTDELLKLKWDCSIAVQNFIFETLNKRKLGSVSVVQVGANDGSINDLISGYIRSSKWRGILIEPVPHFFEMLKQNYAGIEDLILLQAACGSEPSRSPFYQIRADRPLPNEWMRGISSFSRDTIRKHFPSEEAFSEFVEEVTIDVLPLDQILRDYKIDTVDLLLIDTEGWEPDVLSGFSIGKYRPVIVMLEHQHLSEAQRHDLAQVMGHFCYIPIVCFFDTIFVKQDFLTVDEHSVLSAFHLPHFARDTTAASVRTETSRGEPRSFGVKQSQLDLVTVAYLRELPWLKLQAMTVKNFVRHEDIGAIYVIVNDESPAQFTRRFEAEVLPCYGDLASRVQLLYRDDIVPGVRRHHGWHTQQVCKLAASRHVKSNVYLILDTKNHFIRKICYGDFVQADGRLVCWPTAHRGPFETSFKNSYRYFGIDPDLHIDRALPNVTPIPVYRDTVCAMLDSIEKREGLAFQHFFLNVPRTYTEFFLLSAYIIATKGQIAEEYHLGRQYTQTLWSGKAVEENNFGAVINQVREPWTLVFGLHHESLTVLSDVQKQRIIAQWRALAVIDDSQDATEFLSLDRNSGTSGTQVRKVQEMQPRPRDNEDFGQNVEVLLSAIYHRIVSAGDTVIDGGANAGLHSIPLARLVRSSGRLYAYEPHLETSLALSKWIESAGLSRVSSVRNVALGLSNAEVTFYFHKKHIALSSARMMTNERGDWAETRVPMVRLDDEGIVPSCSFIKLDLEGGERDAIFGARGIITRDRPVIAFENGLSWAAERFGYDLREFFGFFEELSYQVYDFTGQRIFLDNLSKEDFFWEFIAFRSGDSTGPLILETIEEFNARFFEVPRAENWQEIIRRVQDPFSTGFWK